MYPFETETHVDYDMARWWLIKAAAKLITCSALAFYGFQLVTVSLYDLAMGYFDPPKAMIGFPLLVICGYIVAATAPGVVGVMEPLIRGKKISVGSKPESKKPDAMSETVDHVDAVIEKRNKNGDWVSSEDALA